MTRDLLQDHDDLRAMMARFAPLLGRDYRAVAATLSADRVVIARLFRAHSAAEDVVVRRLAPRDPLRVKAVADLQRFSTDYSGTIRDWTLARIEAEWRSYGETVLALQRRFRERLDWEERELFPRLHAAGLLMPVSAPYWSIGPSSRAPRDTIAANSWA